MKKNIKSAAFLLLAAFTAVNAVAAEPSKKVEPAY
jgi:hypothetical protein